MLNFKKTIIYLFALIVAGTACNKSISYETSPTGLKYHFFEDKEGEKAKVGDFMTLHFIYTCKDTTGKDSVLRNTWKDGMPIQVIVQQSSFKGGLEEGLQMLSVGDSVAFSLNTDSLFKKTFMAPRPAFIDSASDIVFYMKVLKIQNKEEFEKDQAKLMEERKAKMEAEMAAQKTKDAELINAYVAQNNLTVKTTESGVTYVITQQGKGANVQKGQKVKVHYVGKLLNGTEFDSSIGKDPFEFIVGVGQVIPGWDEGLQLLNKGSKATLIIPSTLAYGPMAMGDRIPANSILLFDVEIVDIMK